MDDMSDINDANADIYAQDKLLCASGVSVGNWTSQGGS